jgi:hypothetical protein
LNELNDLKKKAKLTHKHYISGNMETGIIPFTNDVFQFQYNNTEYILFSVSHHFKTLSTEQNPIDEINNILKSFNYSINGINEIYDPIKNISLYPEYDTQDVNYYNSYLFDRHSFRNIHLIKPEMRATMKKNYSQIMDILKTKDWEITYHTRGSKRRYHRVFKIEFKNKYKIEPHVLFYVKPYTDMFQYKIVYITLKYAIVEVSIIKENSIINGEYHATYYTEYEQKREVKQDQIHTLHWQVTGILDE